MANNRTFWKNKYYTHLKILWLLKLKFLDNSLDRKLFSIEGKDNTIAYV